MSKTTQGKSKKVLSNLGWYGVPTLVILLVIGYLGLAMAWNVDPPLMPVEGTSMRPHIVTGDLVVLHGVIPSQIRVGEIIAVNVPKTAQQQYSLPPRVVHRVVKIEHPLGKGLVFQTKGDANAGPDVFQTPASDVIGSVVTVIPYAGYPVLFFASRQGEIFLGVAVLMALIYLLLLWADERSASRGDSVEALERLAEETELLRGLVAQNVSTLSSPPGTEDNTIEDLITTLTALPEMHRLVGLLEVDHDRIMAMDHTVNKLTAAIDQYAEHLKSHTAVMQALANTASELQQAATALRYSVESKDD